MSLSSTSSRNDYTGNGSASNYSYTFPVVVSGDLIVQVVSTSTPPSVTMLSENTDYTVNGAGDASGGSIDLIDSGQAWLTAGKLTTGYKLVLRRIRPVTQLTDIRNQGAFYPEIHEDTFDTQTMVDQQQQEQLNRTVMLPVNFKAADFNPTLPTDFNAPGAFLQINASGNGFTTNVAAGTGAVYGTPTQEVPSGLVNGSNTIFTLSNTPITNASVSFYVDGLIQIQGTDYTISGAAITTTSILPFGSKPYAVYQH